MRCDRLTSKPARPSSAPMRCRRPESSPCGSPRMRPCPMRCTAMPGAALAALACTTQAMTRSTGITAAILPCGSTLASGRAPSAAMPLANHHGTPFIAGSTTVSAPSSGASVGASALSAGLFTAMMTRSCGPSSCASSEASATAPCSRSPPCSRRQPWSRSATSVAPRASAATCALPSRARRVPSKPPIAPAPTTHTFIDETCAAGTPGRSAHVQAAVQREVRPGGEGRLLAHQPGDDGSDLGRLAEALHRDGGDDFLETVGLDGAHHVGADVAGGHGVDGDAARGDLLRERHGEAVDAGFGGRVVGLAELAALAVHRGDVHDAAPAALDHAVDHLLGDVEQRVEVGLDDRTPGIQIHLLKRAVARDAGVVHQNVDRPDLGTRSIKCVLGGVPVGDVTLGSVNVAAFRAHFRQPAVLARGTRAAPGDHRVAVAAQAAAGGSADATHAAGNIGNPFRLRGHRPIPRCLHQALTSGYYSYADCPVRPLRTASFAHVLPGGILKRGSALSGRGRAGALLARTGVLLQPAEPRRPPGTFVQWRFLQPRLR